MELDRARAAEIAERVIELRPWTCDVRMFETDEGSYVARLIVALGDPTEPDLSAMTEQLRQLADLIEAEGLKVAAVSTLNVTLAGAGTDP